MSSEAALGVFARRMYFVHSALRCEVDYRVRPERLRLTVIAAAWLVTAASVAPFAVALMVTDIDSPEIRHLCIAWVPYFLGLGLAGVLLMLLGYSPRPV